MGKLEESKGILSAIGMPKQQTNDRSAYVLLSLANLKEDDLWKNATRYPKRIIDMMDFMRLNYNKIYKPNTRETIRKDTIHQFVEGAVAEKNTDRHERPTNSPRVCYSLTNEMLSLIRTYGTRRWQNKLRYFKSIHSSLSERYSQQRNIARMPVVVNGQEFSFSLGDHNALQKAVIEEFAPRFAKGAEVLYVGDAENKDLVKNHEILNQIGVKISDHDKLPDIVLYLKEKKWLFFIETVTSVGSISVKRLKEIESMIVQCSAGKIYVTAFPNTKIYKKFIDKLAWETEIWIADSPDHMIHLNGDNFIGPRKA